MASKKKGARIIVALSCSECKRTNNYTMINKTVLPKLEVKKYCSQCRTHTLHTSRDKLK